MVVRLQAHPFPRDGCRPREAARDGGGSIVFAGALPLTIVAHAGRHNSFLVALRLEGRHCWMVARSGAVIIRW